MTDFLNAAIDANIEIGKLIRKYPHDYLCKEISVGAGGDISRRIDLLAEDIFVENLKKIGNIKSEESGFIEGDGKFDIIIDPIDGSDNFASNMPYFGTSVALKQEDKHIAAVVVNLANGDILYKDKKQFQRANIESLNFVDVKKNSFSKIGIFERSYSSKVFCDIMKKENIKYRSPGAFALSLAYAHDVNFVIYEGNMRIYDIEAGLFMCENLYKIVKQNLLFISKDKEIFDRISQLFRKGEEK